MKNIHGNSFIIIENMFYFTAPSFPKVKNFLRLIGVKRNSYMGTTFSRMFDYCFKDSTNLYREYRKYYSKEFESFDAYLDIKHNLYNKEIKMFNSKDSYYKNLTATEYYKINDLFTDENICKLFRLFMGEPNEN